VIDYDRIDFASPAMFRYSGRATFRPLRRPPLGRMIHSGWAGIGAYIIDLSLPK
jgi:hypothetical protein